MRVRRISGRDFRRYRTFDIELAPGLTVIRGPNEAGKTTVQRALELALTKRVTSTAGELEALRSWDAPPEARSIITVEFEEDEEDGQQGRHAREDVRRVEGDGPARVRGPVDQRSDPRRPGDGRADGDPDGGLLPVDRVGPPFRARATCRATRAPCGTVSRRRSAAPTGGPAAPARSWTRRSTTSSTRGDRNPGRLKVAEKAVEDARAAVDQGEMALAQLERDRDALARAPTTGGPTPRPPWPSAGACSRRPARPSASPRNATPPRSATSAIARPSTSPPRWPSWRAAIRRPHPLAVLETGVERLRTLDGRIRELRAALSGEIEVTFDLAPEPTWRPLSRVSLALVAIGILLAGGPVVLEFLGVAELGIAVQAVGAIIAVVGLVLAAVALWLRRSVNQQAQLRDVEIDRRLRGRSDMEAELVDCELQASAQLGSLGLTDLAEAEDLLAREEAHVAADRSSSRPARGARRQGTARDAGVPARHRRPRDLAEDERARGARPDRQGAAGARTARGRGPRPGERPRAGARRRGQRPRPGRGQRRRRRAGRRSRRAPGRLARAAGRHATPPAGLRCHAPGHRSRRAGHDEDRDALPRGAHGA